MMKQINLKQVNLKQVNLKQISLNQISLNQINFLGNIINNKNIMLISLLVTFCLVLFGGLHHTLLKAEHPGEKNYRAIEVQEGDTLLSIAHEYAYPDLRVQDYINEVKQINHLQDDRIHSGCFLVVPVYYTELSFDAAGVPSDEK